MSFTSNPLYREAARVVGVVAAAVILAVNYLIENSVVENVGLVATVLAGAELVRKFVFSAQSVDDIVVSVEAATRVDERNYQAEVNKIADQGPF